MLDGKLFPALHKKSVLVFWASWCGPCSIELSRINSAINNKEISSNNIFAVNMGENPELVNRVVHERKYSMPVIFDNNGELANLLHVKVTPTIAYRIQFFLKE